MAKANLQPIIDAVTEMTGTVDSAVALIDKLAAAVLEAPTLAEAQAVAREIQAKRTQLADAVVANTPAENE